MNNANAAWNSEIKVRVAEIEIGAVALLTHGEFISAFDEARAELIQRREQDPHRHTT